jgi:polar amino acid transport system substrate-binding protein
MRYYVLFPLVLLLFLTSHANAAEITTLYASKVFPFVEINEDGEIFGPAVDIVSQTMQRAGISTENISFQHITWARALDDVTHYPGYGAFCLVRTLQREREFVWVGPIGETVLAIFARKRDRIEIGTLADVINWRTGIVRSSAFADTTTQKINLESLKPIEVKNDNILFKMLDEGRLDLVVYPVLGTWKTIRKLNLDPGDFEVVYRFEKVQLFLALNPQTDPRLVSRLQDALDKLKEAIPGEKSLFDRIYDQYR